MATWCQTNGIEQFLCFTNQPTGRTIENMIVPVTSPSLCLINTHLYHIHDTVSPSDKQLYLPSHPLISPVQPDPLIHVSIAAGGTVHLGL